MLLCLGSSTSTHWKNLRSLMKAQSIDCYWHLSFTSRSEFMALLKLVGSPLVPVQVQSNQNLLTRPLMDCSIRDATAKYIVQQYIAATGGLAALNALESMYAIGQGLDPRYTANLFLDAICVGDKTIQNEECFSLKLDTSMHILKAQSSPHTEFVRHTIWGYFSQRTGLLVRFKDNKLVRMKTPKGNDFVFWETNIKSVMEDYRYVDGINIVHGGITVAMLHRYGGLQNYKRKIEETWEIKDIGFNIRGLSNDCFLPPSDLDEGT